MSNTATAKYPSGFELKFESLDGTSFTEERVQANILELEGKAIANLTAGNPYPYKTEKRPQPISSQYGFATNQTDRVPATPKSKQEWYSDFYKENLKILLKVPEDQIDFETGLSDKPERLRVKPEDVSPWSLPTSPLSLQSMGQFQAPLRKELSDRASYAMMPTQEGRMA
jgi:hypothetical protein